MHSHFAGPKVNQARHLLARRTLIPGEWLNDFQDSRTPFVPDIVTTGMCYAGLGYTTAVDAAIPLHAAAAARQEMRRMPMVDTHFLLLAGSDRRLLDSLAEGRKSEATEIVAERIASTGAAGIKLVSPGDTNQWKAGWRSRIHDIDQTLRESATTPRSIIEGLAHAVDANQLPHPLHVHCNALGMPGNWRTTLATMQAIGDQRAHFAHIQFHSYRGADDEDGFGSAVKPLVDFVDTHPQISVDVGQVMFGESMAMTADSALGHYLSEISGQPWISHDAFDAGGCGILPLRYRRTDRINALQWAIGLEWMLTLANPWQLALSTDHPNGGSFLTYPRIMALLMSRELRTEQLSQVHSDVLRRSRLHELDREYSLEEIAIITRAAPAKLLGLEDKGHLRPGAVADVVVYDHGDSWEETFAFPRYVFKNGDVVVDNGSLRIG